MRVGILSDTHGLLRPQVKDVLKTCDVILHGGDINRETIIKELEAFAPLYVVRGNNDKEWAEGMPEELQEKWSEKKPERVAAAAAAALWWA